MNSFFQIAIALIPIVVIFVLFSIFMKKTRALNITFAVLLGVALVVSVVIGLNTVSEEKEIAVAEKKVEALKLEDQINVIYSVAVNTGDCDYALSIIQDLQNTNCDDVQITMCAAYLNAASGDWKTAKILYEKAVELGAAADEKFAKYCTAAFEESKIDRALLTLKDDNFDVSKNSVTDLKNYARSYIKERVSNADENIVKVASVIGSSEELFDEYLDNGSVNDTELNKLIKSLEKALEKKSSLLKMDVVRECRAKLLVLGRKYEALANTIDKDSTYVELAIVSELYINDLVTDAAIAKKYTREEKKKIRDVCDQLEKVAENLDNEEEKVLVEALIKKLKDEMNPSAMEFIKNNITELSKDENFSDKPKAHIQLAKIAYEEDDEEEAKSQISEALKTLGVCEDEEFYIPLSEIARVINDKDSGSDLKNVPQYVDEVLNSTSDKIAVSVVEKAQNDMQNNGYDDPDEGTTNDAPFDTFMGDVVSQMRISVNITNVNTDNFPKVSVTVNIDESLSVSAEQLKEMITVTDCGFEIADFDVKKIEYASANILLCCDVSGSMSGRPIEDLKNAVKKFVETSSGKENIALVTFDSCVTEVYDFGTDKSTIISAAEGIYSGGGTNMYGAVIESIEKFSANNGELNFILLLSDGEDNDSHSLEEINDNIGIPCIEKQIVLYSLGLGDSVNIDYMDSLATATNGAFVYVADSSTVEDFYNSLRSQILNQYVITFEAKDTLTVNRTVKIHFKEDPLSQDVANYSLLDAGSDVTMENEFGVYVVNYSDKGVYGLDTSLVYKSKLSTEIKIKGFGFKEDDNFSVSLDGKLDYEGNVTCEYVDSNTLNMTIPGGIACGKYDVIITIGDMTARIKDGISVVIQGSQKTVEFGPYVFTAYEKVENGNTITLSGMVNMNGWLNFNGDVVLTKDSYDERRINLTNSDGCYVTYYSDTAKGLAKMMADKGVKLPLPSLGTVTLINDSTVDPEAEEYPVETIPLPLVYFADVLSFETPGVSLYPNRLHLASDAFTTALPMQEKLLKKSGLGNLFEFDIKLGGTITNKTIGINGTFSNEPTEENSSIFSPVNLGSAPIYVSPATYEIKIDTEKNEYSIDFGIKVAFIPAEGIGFSAAWKERENDKGLQNLFPYEVLLKADVPVKTNISGVPLTFRDFQLGASDMDLNESILKWKLVGKFTLETSKVSDYIPGLDEYIDDPSLFSLKDTTIELSLGNFYFGIFTELQFLEEITVGRVEMEAGKISVTSALLGLDSETASGIRAEIMRHIEWYINNCNVELDGTATLHMHSKFIGIEGIGEVSAEIGWWIFKVVDFSAKGMGAIGVQFYEDLPTFVIKLAKQDSNGYDGYYLLWNKNTSLAHGKLEV